MSPDARRRAAKVQRFRMAGVLMWAAIMVVGMLIGLIWFARPSYSTVEKRQLEQIPAFTAQEFLDGTYFSGVSKWYSDTYPLRELMVGFGRSFSSLYGVRLNDRVIGGNVVADELPPVEEGSSKASSTVATTKLADEGPVAMPDERVMAEEVQNKIMSGLYVSDGKGYNIYYFVQDAVERYTSAINLCAEKLDGVSSVYSILVPNTSGAMLDEATLASLGGSDPREAIRYFNSLYSDKVHHVFIYDTLREHNDEYIYFKTDHHWTERGAYYAYLVFCAEKGLEPVDLNTLEYKRFEPFIGTFYSETGDAEMGANPDYVEAWVPAGTNDMVYWDSEGQQYEGNVITDTTNWPENAKTSCFIEDYPLVKIENPKIDDDSSCLLVKDSFGDFFASLLVDHYHCVWVIDPRSSNRNIPQFARENNINDIIFLNNMTLATTDGISSALMSQIQD